ncbi:hypothetical protein NGTWS0302_33350 [Mycolicibacterium cyprinidarum]|uniref:HNH nuclease domain-containing protein n=1 Tax=Mycolicibacterium cyprinidarum TaxID=2860311 RepID=A0ABQ4VBA6_9MYCO|nr:hypothetical protein NGTWS1702_10780 [Mycolicibacterium sp. NGTWSNA01]GJF13255.1 hypothetical protein NGTWS0302_33350 [Mycolicibacterium sp. NGTWS0302]GJF15705.1 hypothetical protein NGTWS1803_30670 [Mycolicibacterium sp. NGTWS1803]
MFDGSQTAAARSIVDKISSSWRAKNQADARMLTAIGDLFDLQLRHSGECASWAADTTDAVAAEISAALNISAGWAADYVLHARCLREELPTVGAVFAAGSIDYSTFRLVASRTSLIEDPEVMTTVDTEVAAALVRWRSLSRAMVRARVDRIVLRHDRDALRRRERKRRDRNIEIWDSGDGLAQIRGFLRNMDAHLLQERLNALAATVCDQDLRSPAARRADAIGALAVGLDRLECGCERPDCPALDKPAPPNVIIHVVAEAATVAGNGTEPAAVIGTHWLIPPEILAELARSAALRPVLHPGDTAPEPGYTPSRALADFVRCRDLTCRFPGCDTPATRCDLDHTTAYQDSGPTHASNLKSLCRKHHLLKTFWGWHDQQLRDGTIIWTSPTGETYITTAGSALLFPALCEPTAALPMLPGTTRRTDPTTAMPRRSTTRTQNRTQRMQAERRLNRHNREADQRWQQQLHTITAIHDPPPF